MPAMCRLGDPDVPHCSGMVRKGHVKSVFANGRPLSCQGHVNTTHLFPKPPIPCPGHATVIMKGSPNVFVNNIGVSRQGDNNTVHLLPGLPCPSHARPIATGSTTVFINGKGCGRIGDAISSCTSVAEGSDNVFAG